MYFVSLLLLFLPRFSGLFPILFCISTYNIIITVPIKFPGMNVPNNPWTVEHLEEFLYYCCPECDEKSQSKELFLQHALGTYA